MDKSYDPGPIESRWYERWEADGRFSPSNDADSDPYCIMLPPPNVTGRLHMGHAFQDTIMDALTRFHRMDGDQTLWQCGTDHAGIATQMVVERRLAERGENRRDLGREQFVSRVWDWKEESGGHITRQMRRLGASVDWDNERFTMDEGLSAAVGRVFVQLYREGLIYRGKRLVNWDPVLHTALSDLEVVSEEENGHLWHLKYPRVDGKGHVVVATTRPETMLGDVAIAVSSDDERYQDLIGQHVHLPLTDRTIPVVADHHVDAEFGTGCVKITPAHDFDDYEVGRRHDLGLINVLTDDAAMNDTVPEPYRGLDRYAARKQIVADLTEQGLIDKIEPHKLKVPRGDRSGAVLEPYLTDQWFVDLTREETADGRPGGKRQIADPAIQAVREGQIEFVPGNWSKTYFQWMENLQDWCISRQLWWGHRIPAWFDDDGNIYVGETEQQAREHYGVDPALALRQDDDVLDTWFSSALWPFSTLGWPENTDRLKTFYPTSVLVTGFDIIFFWVARMIMFGCKFMDEVPFRQVYVHALVRDAQGQKMSKSKGNVLDPLDLIDGIGLEELVAKRTTGLMQPEMAPKIEAATREEFPDGLKSYGTDALRFTFAAMATPGRDIRFDIGRIDGYRNFCNKLWNAGRYVLMNAEDEPVDPRPEHRSTFDRWILSRLNEVIAETRNHLEAYRFDLMARTLYEFTWNDYCDWYLELTKPVLHGDDVDAQRATRYVLLTVLEQLLRLLHPIMPFLTEEIWQRVAPRIGIVADSISIQSYPICNDDWENPDATADTVWVQQVLLGVRQIRGEMDIPPGKPLTVLLTGGTDLDHLRMERHSAMIGRLGRLESIARATDDLPDSAMALVGDLKLNVPLAGVIDKDAELTRLEKELGRRTDDQRRAAAKLNNEKFVSRAPDQVVDAERQKVIEAEAAIAEIKAQMERLKRL